VLRADCALRLGAFRLELDLEVQAGAPLVLLGPSGAGKSTVLRLLAGLQRPDRGEVWLDGRVLTRLPGGVQVPPRAREMALVFQTYGLFPHLSVLENVAFGRRARRLPDPIAYSRRLLEQLGLDTLGALRPQHLSGGQAQRVAIARALATEPKALLLDEPLAALDSGTRGEVRHVLREVVTDPRRTSILVTHDPVDALTLGTALAVMEEGRIVQRGSPAEILAAPRTQQVATMAGLNLIRGRLLGSEEGALRVAIGNHEIMGFSDERVQGPAVYCTVRAQDVSLAREASPGSPRNVLAAVVRSLTVIEHRVRVELRGDFDLVAEITESALRELDLQPGTRVTASFKASAVRVYD
jgi:molybdate transport system ATP-binding protein